MVRAGANTPRRSPSDIETRATSDHHAALRLWLRMLATTNVVESAVRHGLKAQFETTLPRFDLMAQLERAPEGLKMGELSRRMMVSGGNVTGITDLLEREGLVVRIGDPDDRRALRVRLTPAGRKAFRSMAEAHERWIIDAMSVLDRTQLSQLNDLLGRIKSHVTAEKEKGQ